MNQPPILLSLARISNLDCEPFDVERLDRAQWQTGDYVIGEVLSHQVRPVHEHCSGRMVMSMPGDRVVGALGARAATLEVVGDWQSIGPDGHLHELTAAGLLGKATSLSSYGTTPVDLRYDGHVTRRGKKLTMRQFVPSLSDPVYNIPTVLLIGTSMSSGKTTSARVIVRELKRWNLRVAGVKLTGAGRYRDILAMRDSGADAIFDFVDVGLPSTVFPPSEYREALATLLKMIAQSKPDVVVAEAGASPLEPYNGDVAIEALRDHVKMTVLCASDPYAVVGVTQGFGFQADLAAGIAASTSAGVAVIQKLTGMKALNLVDPETHAELRKLLSQRLEAGQHAPR